MAPTYDLWRRQPTNRLRTRASLSPFVRSGLSDAAATIQRRGFFGDTNAGYITLDDATLVATGTLRISDAGAFSLGDAVVSSQGRTALSGSAGVTAADAAASGAGVVVIVAASGPTLGDAGVSSNAAVWLAATAMINLASAVDVGTGTVSGATDTGGHVANSLLLMMG